MISYAITSAELRRRLAANVRRLGTAASLTVKQAAARAEMHLAALAEVEAGHNNATLATIVRMAGALNVNPAELFEEPRSGSAGPR